MDNVITVRMCEGKLATKGEELVTYALGSCVGICLYDSQKLLAGMVHIMLPSKESSLNKTNDYKFADAGIEKLLGEMLRKGAEKRRITAKIVGGAKMFETDGMSLRIGERNVIAVKETLEHLKIPLIAEDTGGNFGRSIWLQSVDGLIRVKSVKNGIYTI